MASTSAACDESTYVMPFGILSVTSMRCIKKVAPGNYSAMFSRNALSVTVGHRAITGIDGNGQKKSRLVCKLTIQDVLDYVRKDEWVLVESLDLSSMYMDAVHGHMALFDRDFGLIASFPNLKRLLMDGFILSDLEPMRSLTKLEVLSMIGVGRCSSSLSLEPLRSLPIREVSFSSCGLQAFNDLHTLNWPLRVCTVKRHLDDLSPILFFRTTLEHLIIQDVGTAILKRTPTAMFPKLVSLTVDTTNKVDVLHIMRHAPQSLRDVRVSDGQTCVIASRKSHTLDWMIEVLE